MLTVTDLTKVYRKGVRANDDLSLAVAAGEVVGLVGHNGAGKTTLLNQIIGLVRPTSGSITIDGVDVVANPALARRACSLQPQAHTSLDRVSPRLAIEIMARIRGAGRQRARERTAELIAALALEEWADKPGDALSGGVLRLTAFCIAAAEPGRIVMLDEPTNDVDPVRRRLLWRAIRALAEGGSAVLLVTHNVLEAERGVDRLAVLHHGRIVAEGTPAHLRAGHDDRLRLQVVAATEPLAAELATRFSGPYPPAVTGRRVVLAIEADAAGAALAWANREHAAGAVEEFSVTPVSLEDVYIGLTAEHEGVDRVGRAA
jgi:ABC-2 type transport system ATP-binding protein